MPDSRRWRTPIPEFDLTSAVRSIISADSIENLFENCLRSYDALGFSEFTVGGFDLATGNPLPCERMTTLDARTREAYRLEVVNVDPIMERAVRTGAVVQWDCSSIGGEEKSGRFHEFLQDLELRSGLNMPLHASGSEWWGIVIASRVPRMISPDLVSQAFALSASVLLKRTLLLAAEAAPRITDDPRLELLSAEQREILRWITQGKSNADISLILGHSKRAVDYHVAQILRKLGVATRTQAAALLAT